MARTGRAEAGWHYYLAPAGLAGGRGLLEGVDYKGAGGYVVAISPPYPDRGASLLVRVYLEVRLHDPGTGSPARPTPPRRRAGRPRGALP